MADPLTRVRFDWSGFQGAPGYTNLYTGGVQDSATVSAFAAGIAALFTAAKPFLPADVILTCEPEATLIDSGTGKPAGTVVITPPSPVQGAGTGNYSGAAGWGIDWLTGVYDNGRQVRGRTFFVPGAQSAFTSAGAVAPLVISTMATAITTFLGGPGASLSVFSRPTAKRLTGMATIVTSGVVASKSFVLRTRRD